MWKADMNSETYADESTDNFALGIYRHYKGGYYRVLYIAQHSETDERLVVYRRLNEERGDVWVRPLAMFRETVAIGSRRTQRFSLIEEEADIDDAPSGEKGWAGTTGPPRPHRVGSTEGRGRLW
ncbi:DUF1653 domain-containing protein [Streptomyces sp. NPDC051214]|uniref:DUF1653 domain-containing protein n=1 Tax=Streptomyces sp. NPDC051214 TaxID=3155282 RepID=UPI0034349D92